MFIFGTGHLSPGLDRRIMRVYKGGRVYGGGVYRRFAEFCKF